MKAFPTTYRNYDESISHDCTGMDLRDYFAAKAMQAIIGKSDDASLDIEEIDNWIGTYAYVVADAMMEARES
jgi:hypothetical protein